MVDAKTVAIASQMGLLPSELVLIREVLVNATMVSRGILFGSRAKGTHKTSSDVDLALEGTLCVLDAERVAAALDELPMPYRFDVLAVSPQTSPELLAHIARVGVVIFERTEGNGRS